MGDEKWKRPDSTNIVESEVIPEQADNEVEKDPLKRKLQEMNKKRDEETKSSLKKRDEETKFSLKKLDEDRLANPHLALISDHLWWLALGVKLGLIMMVITLMVIADG